MKRSLLALAAFFALLPLVSRAADDAPKIGGLPVGKVLFLGNSITLHGPKADIGWTGNWGMAASTLDRDFVHLLTADIARAAGGKTPQILVRNLADFERGYESFDLAAGLQAERAFGADVVVLAIGENVAEPTTEAARTSYGAAFRRLLAALQEAGRPAIFVRGCFWPSPAKDEIMRQAAGEARRDLCGHRRAGTRPVKRSERGAKDRARGRGGSSGRQGHAGHCGCDLCGNPGAREGERPEIAAGDAATVWLWTARAALVPARL